MSIPLLIQATGTEVKGPTVRIPAGDWVFSVEGKSEGLFIYLNGEGPSPMPKLITISQFSNMRITGKDCQEVTVKLRENKPNGS